MKASILNMKGFKNVEQFSNNSAPKQGEIKKKLIVLDTDQNKRDFTP